MPNIFVDLDAELYERLGDRISEEVHQAQIDVLNVVADDLFQVFTPHAPGEIKFDPGYNGVDRRSLLMIRILMVHMYPVGKKRELFAAIVHRLEAIGIRPEDVLISVTENGFEDWYAGKL
jgi:hypothetical protein